MPVATKSSGAFISLCLMLWTCGAFAGDAGGDAKSNWVSLNAFEQAEFWGNVSGGRRQGLNGNGLLTLSLNADLGSRFNLDGWRLYGSVFQIHGRSVTQDRVGNIQTISNIEATRATRLYNLWIEKTFLDGRLNVRIGQEGANDEMMISSNAQLFLNSSFGYPALLATGLPSGGPNYPLATPMARFVWRLTEHVTWSGAIFNGDPAGPGVGDPQLRNAYGMAFRLRDAPLVFNELWYDARILGEAGRWKIGFWRHWGDFSNLRYDSSGGKSALSGLPGQSLRGDFGVYGVFDQTLWKDPRADRNLDVWGLIMLAPSDRNLNDLFIEGGLTFKGAFAARPADKAGVAFGYLRTGAAAIGYYKDGFSAATGLAPADRYELVTELTYQFVQSPSVSLQPSVQYAVNPGARLPSSATRQMQLKVKDALVIGARLGIMF